ncbi:AraC family transcriptional regulator ligand-binding domain-containing protein [Nocardia sp. CDC153]|uniref:AraC family transcriptional regulator ligand-binding domain-containing protein n=1 Tax=Nocardia sp. CDC153 TaxID=3112167 RepID=UPI002DB8A937|nr:AraC family transcriptional regulator ligand-binding domain-containing protein [Nocardia sp. CDC153]MEC3952592.1 AraC family transcriptional regulator ligand-binding domain-containing protein [Nocardia sp. CDC153]
MTGSDSPLLARFVLTRARSAGLDPVELARAAGIGSAALDGPPGSVPGQCYLRLWELFERRIELPHVGLRAADRYGMGELGMMDYLVSTAATVGEAFRAAAEFGSRLTSTRRLEVVADTEHHLTVAAGTAVEGRGAELAAQASFAFLTARVRLAARARIVPVAVTFRQAAPRDHTAFTAFFGTPAIEFGADADTLTLDRTDRERVHHSSDPRLADVLRRGATVASLSTPPARAWVDLLAAELDSLPPETTSVRSTSLDTVSLGEIAWRLGTSARTLQRRLAAAGTTWSRELAGARIRAAG